MGQCDLAARCRPWAALPAGWPRCSLLSLGEPRLLGLAPALSCGSPHHGPALPLLVTHILEGQASSAGLCSFLAVSTQARASLPVIAGPSWRLGPSGFPIKWTPPTACPAPWTWPHHSILVWAPQLTLRPGFKSFHGSGPGGCGREAGRGGGLRGDAAPADSCPGHGAGPGCLSPSPTSD